LKRDVITLQKKNKQLQEDLDEAMETAENLSQPKKSSRAGASTKKLQAKVDALRAEVTELEEACTIIKI
jgi:ABC-type phosphate transport system auxiliary subunit